jgi:hypothetical protein
VQIDEKKYLPESEFSPDTGNEDLINRKYPPVKLEKSSESKPLRLDRQIHKKIIFTLTRKVIV